MHEGEPIRSRASLAFALCCAVVSTGTAAAPAAAGEAARGGFVLCRQPAEGEEEKAALLDLPGGNIFGFTDPSDVGSAGDCGVSLEVTGREGKRHGSYFAGSAKLELAATVTDGLVLAVSPFFSWYHIHHVPGLDDRSSFSFDGLSAELQYRFLERSTGQRLAMTAAVEPRWARTGPVTGERVEAYALELKLFADVLLAQHWFAAANLNYTPAWEQTSSDRAFARFAGANVSTAIAWAPHGADSKVVVGLENRLVAAFEGLGFGRHLGHAWLLGPSLMVRLSDGVALNVAWTPQIAGDGPGVSGHRDLASFEAQQFRVRLAVAF